MFNSAYVSSLWTLNELQVPLNSHGRTSRAAQVYPSVEIQDTHELRSKCSVPAETLAMPTLSPPSGSVGFRDEVILIVTRRLLEQTT